MTADVPVALDLLRRQVAALLSQIDTRALPQPDKVHRKTEDFPGREWSPSKGWRMFTVETPDGAGAVFIDHACDDINYRWGEPGDWEALPIDQARRIGLALLAAAERADELFAGVSRLDAFRRAGEDEPSSQPEATVRTLKPTRTNARRS